MINPFVLQVLGYLVRQALLLLVGALGLTQVIQPIIDANLPQFNQLVASIALGVAVLCYGLWRQFRGRQKLLQAAAAAGLSEQHVEAMVRDEYTVTPSVLTRKTDVPR